MSLLADYYVDDGFYSQGYTQEGVTVYWPVREIFVPRASMPIIQLTPIEIRELDLNAFRLALKDLEDDAEGMVWPYTHNHNPTVTVGGVTLARVVEITNGYTVTFENGLYAVNLIGANSNVADVVNINSVSVRTANSSGMAVPLGTTVWDEAGGVEIDITPREALRLMLAALAGKLSGAPSGPVVIRNVGDTKDRITATVDGSGNRTVVTVDGS